MGWGGVAVLVAVLAVAYSAARRANAYETELLVLEAELAGCAEWSADVAGDVAARYAEQVQQLRSMLERAQLEPEDLHPHRERAAPRPRAIPRVTNLTFAEFFHEYACSQTPVIVTDVAHNMRADGSGLWTTDEIVAACPELDVPLRKYDKASGLWGGLADTSLRRSLASFAAARSRAGNEWFVFDASLKACKAFVDDFAALPYFANDYYRRLPPDAPKPGWPSLFMGPAGATTAVHIDAYGTAFWMTVLDGAKEWLIAPPAAREHLYYDALKQSFAPGLDLFDLDLAAFPLAGHVELLTATLVPGEWLFVPAGSPHAVRNLAPTTALAGNFIDAANHAHALDVMAREKAGSRARARRAAFAAVDTRMMVAPPAGLAWRDFNARWPASPT
ncbi:JmjC domain-containing protein [Thecamonas trahens ATCC 50062]|uniref:JmjC domain-containing protein n=1 Tax=Thecamonas trahens ATCC 50062 TaxID=461836 RepID=A0A0L0DEZ6_THETB|nr:JmjC domain-containing protein [Thecamonas trahens ATCC 50062]KNC50859.1 JmjC domain-containing protein [Thecamonas trahens ATCC 50062]|eukprot:XP_013756811.1 JmjC domain-containing protein [Thecamonas trahens ATCC 50062]